MSSWVLQSHVAMHRTAAMGASEGLEAAFVLALYLRTC